MRWCVLMVLAAAAGCDDAPAPRGEPKQVEKNVKPDKDAAIAGRVALPVTAVTLYAGGAARMEHKGTVQGDASVELAFKSTRLAGALKSMMVDDGDNAMSTTIQPMDSLAAAAQSSRRVNLAENPTRSELLSQLRGARVRLQVGDENREVTIVSIESIEQIDKSAKSDKANGQLTVITRQLNVLSGNALQSIKLDDVRKIELADPRAQEDIRLAVESLWQKDADRKSVVVRLRGKGERPVRIGYTIEAQPWKVSYRLLLSAKPSLQGWATVANDTDGDWNGVQLNLMGGRPFLLAQDSAADTAAAAKAARGAGVPAGESFRRPRPVPSREALDDEQSFAAGMPGEQAERTPDGPVINASDGFRYTLADVSVPPHSSAVVPIMSDSIAVEPVAVYNDAVLRRNALQGARVRNTSKRYILRGTVTVMEDDQYLGDASIENLAPGRYGLMTWGIDLPVLVDASELVHSTAIAAAEIDAGVLRLDRQHVYARHYVMENEDQKDRTLIIEHPVRRGWRLVEPATPMEATETVYRFRQALAAATRAKFVVKEQITEADGIDLVPADVQTVSLLSRDSDIPATIREALAKVLPMKQSIAATDRQIQRLQMELDQLVAEKAKSREQTTSTNDFGDFGSRSSPKPEQADKEVVKLRETIADLLEKQDAAREAMEAAIRKVTVAREMRSMPRGEK